MEPNGTQASGATRTTTTDQRIAYLCMIACLAAAALAAIGFLVGIPGNDFVGDLYWADLLAGPLRHGVIPDWNRRAAMGHSTTIQLLNLMLVLPSILGSYLNGGDLTTAAKVSYTLFHIFSIVPCYLLARLYTEKKLAAALGASFYLVAPLHLSEWTITGHWAIPQTYFWLPLALWLLVRTVRERRSGLAAATALVLTLMLWADNERAATAVPVLAAFAGFEIWRLHGTRRSGLLYLGLTALIGSALCAFFVVPALLDLDNFLLMRETSQAAANSFKLWPTVSQYQLYHPLQLFDLLLSEPMRGGLSPIVHIQFGFAPVALAVVALARLRPDKPDQPRALFFWGLLILLVLLSMGRNSIARSSWNLMGILAPGAPKFILCGLLVAAFSALAWITARRLGRRAALLLVLAAAVTLFTSPFQALRLLPPYSAMRNPLWFLTVNAPLLLALLSAVAFDGLAARGGRVFRLAVPLATALTLVQARPYLDPDSQPRVAAEAQQSFQLLGGVLQADPSEARYAWFPYRESWPYFGYADTFHRKPALYSWVLWNATRWGAGFLAEAYGELTSAAESLVRAPPGDEAAVAKLRSALQRLADANVKYLVTSASVSHQLTRSPDLEPFARAGMFFVLRNALWREDALVRVEDATSGRVRSLSYQRPRDEQITFDVSSGSDSAVLVAESFHPWWHATLDGAALQVRPTAHGLIGLALPSSSATGSRRVELTFARPGCRVVSLLSLAALLVSLALLAKEIVARLRRIGGPPVGPAKVGG
jgi:hypothetical protein